MSDLHKQYKQKLEQTKNLLDDLIELRKKGIHRDDDLLNNKLEQLRQLMSVGKEQSSAQLDDANLDRMVTELNSELKRLDNLVEGRPAITATEILENASGGLALRGISVGEAFSDDCVKRIVLSAPTDVKLMNPLMTQVDKVENFSSESQADHFHRSLDIMGYSAAVTMKGGRFGLNAEADFSKNYEGKDAKESTYHKQVHFESRVLYSVVPTAACELNKFSLKLSKQALQELKSIDTLFWGSENLELVNKKCEDFLAAYGSHINVGVLHFGGVNKFVATYTSDTESKSDQIKYMVRDALSAYVSASYSGLGFSVGGSVSADQINTHASFTNEYEKSEQAKTLLHTTRNGGPQEVNALQLWKIGLVTCNSTWALIDRGRSLSTDFVGIWKLIPNHKDEFEEPYRLESFLVTAWEKMSGDLGSNDQERTFMKGREEIDLLIEKIAKWNSCPILPEKCIEYLQEMLKTVKEVETHTSTNKYWVNKLCTEVNISTLLAKVVQLRDKIDPNDVAMIRFLIRTLVNPVESREFPCKELIMKFVQITENKDIASLAKVCVNNIPDLIRYLKETFIPTLQIEHAKNEEGIIEVSDSINSRATGDLALCVGQLLKDLQLSQKDHEMFFLKVVLMTLHYHWPTLRFKTVVTMEKLHDFVLFIEVSWKQFQNQEAEGLIQLEAFLINVLITAGHFDEGGESLEDEFSETIKEVRQVLSSKVNSVLNMYATRSPFNWKKMTNITNELAKGNMSVCEERKVTICDLESVAIYQDRKTEEQRPLITPNSWIAAQNEFSETLKALGLDKYFPSQISLLSAMEIKMVTRPPKLVEIPWAFIQKLLMIDFHARDHHISVENKSSSKKRPDDGGGSDFEALLEMQNDSDDEDKPIEINTLDAMLAIFTCCDNFLKQTLAEKLFVCKLAIPFLYPLGSEDKVGMSVWALRTINVQWNRNSNGASETRVTERPFPLVSFIRLGRPPLSKSKLMNDILRDDSHDTFFHRDCNNGTVPRRFTDGLVECSWFIASGKEKEHLPTTTMFLNLRGDASSLKKQTKILQEISSVLFVIVTAKDLANAPNIETCQQILETGKRAILFLVRDDNKQNTMDLRAFLEKTGKDILKKVPVICSNTKGGLQKNTSQLKTEARMKLSEVLSGCSDILIERCAQIASNMGIIVDEYGDKACQEGMVSAEKVFRHMEDKQIIDCKALYLPLQGNEWIEYCKLLKKQHRTSGKGSHSSTYEANLVKQKMDSLREKQVDICNRLTPLMKDFMSTLHTNQDVFMYFLKWMNLLLDRKSRDTLPSLRIQYHKVWTEFQEAKRKQNKEKMHQVKSQVDDKEKQLSSASLGLQNLFRELGQIYEAVEGSSEVGKTTKIAVEYLPERAAELLLNGIPFELVDGDASSIPIGWVTAVLRKLENIIGEKRLFVLSVLGIQGSGKSTLLNTMFGLQFAVSAGRCTKGAYMQLIPVDGDTNPPFDYVVVVDTEGLRAPELGQLKYEHDNELATLVIGLGDVTLINIKGENTAEIKDILQIAVHAFLRMNLVRKNIHDNRTCIFVHRNVPALNAEELMMHGCQKLQENLDHMTKEAALSENIADIHSFSQIINFDVQKHVKYFSDLWHGDPPMAPANPGYSQKVRSVRLQLLEEVAVEQKTFLTASDLSIRLSDLWNGVLADDFVFSFRNSLEVKAYNGLQSKYYALEWELQDKMKSWLHTAEIELKRCDTGEDLGNCYHCLLEEFHSVSEENYKEAKACLKKYFNECELQEIIIQWQESKKNQMKIAVEQQKYEGKTDLLSIKEARRVEITQAQKWSGYEVYIMDKAVELADNLKGKEASDAELEEKFDLMWTPMVNDLATKTTDTDIRIDVLMDGILHQRFHAHGSLVRKELEKNPLKFAIEHTSLESSVTLDFVEKEHISVKRRFLGMLKMPLRAWLLWIA